MKSYEFARFHELGNFFGFTPKNPDPRLFFPKTVIIRTKLDTNLRNSNFHEPDAHKFVSSFVLI
jgi:hypothetical protein